MVQRGDCEELTMAFHWRDGVYFERFAGGEVRVTLPVCPYCLGIGQRTEMVWVTDSETYECEPCSGTGLNEVEVIKLMTLAIPAAEWASIIAPVSAIGETSEQYADALSFHGELIGRREPAGG